MATRSATRTATRAATRAATERPGAGNGGDNYILTVGAPYATRAGYETTSNTVGALDPDTWIEGRTIQDLYSDDSGARRLFLRLSGSTAIPGGYSQIELTIEGAADNPYVMDWEAGNRVYAKRTGAVLLTLSTYLDSQVGNDLTVTITGV